jgi:hypothetical protein
VIQGYVGPRLGTQGGSCGETDQGNNDTMILRLQRTRDGKCFCTTTVKSYKGQHAAGSAGKRPEAIEVEQIAASASLLFLEYCCVRSALRWSLDCLIIGRSLVLCCRHTEHEPLLTPARQPPNPASSRDRVAGVCDGHARVLAPITVSTGTIDAYEVLWPVWSLSARRKCAEKNMQGAMGRRRRRPWIKHSPPHTQLHHDRRPILIVLSLCAVASFILHVLASVSSCPRMHRVAPKFSHYSWVGNDAIEFSPIFASLGACSPTSCSVRWIPSSRLLFLGVAAQWNTALCPVRWGLATAGYEDRRQRRRQEPACLHSAHSRL